MVPKEEYGHPTYQVGDVVRVVDTPYRECPFSWVGFMDHYCGCECVVRAVDYSWANQTYKYILELDGDGDITDIIWCSGCLLPVADELPEPSQSELNAWFDALLMP